MCEDEAMDKALPTVERKHAKDEPRRQKLRSDIEEPSPTKSSPERAEPSRATVRTDREVPKFARDSTESA